MKILKLQMPHCKPLIFLLFHLMYTIMLFQNKYVNNSIIDV